MCIFVHYAIADGDQTFIQAQMLFSQGKFAQAKTGFTKCLTDPEFADVQGNIQTWIGKCDAAIQQQNRNAQVSAERQKKLTERRNNQFVYISVNATETGTTYASTVSAMSEVMRLNGRSFCPNIDDASTIVSVTLDIKTERIANGFYRAYGSGVVSVGNVMDANDYVGQWSVACEATSAVNEGDAERLMLNKLNHKLGYALDNLLNGRPQESGYYIPEQSIAVDFANDGEDPEYLREYINGYISKTPGITLSTALDETRNAERDKIYKIQAQYVKTESRAPIHELEGFSQILRISVKTDEDSGFYTFVGELSELATGKSLTTVTIDGADFGIKKLTTKNQELAAKLLAVGLGFKEWEIGEDIGGYKLASANGMHGLILRVEDSGYLPMSHATSCVRDGWRFPHAEELLDMFEDKKTLGLTNAYWTADISEGGKYKVVDFSSPSKDSAIKLYKSNKVAAAVILVKEF